MAKWLGATLYETAFRPVPLERSLKVLSRCPAYARACAHTCACGLHVQGPTAEARQHLQQVPWVQMPEACHIHSSSHMLLHRVVAV